MTSSPQVNIETYLVKTHALSRNHPTALDAPDDFVIYPIGNQPANEALKQPELLPISGGSSEQSSQIDQAWQTEAERNDLHFNLYTCYPGPAALMVANLSIYPSDDIIPDYSTSREFQENYIRFFSRDCGPALTLAVFYSTALSLDRESVRENLEEYFDLLFEEYPGVGGIFFQQIGSDAILTNPNFKQLCNVIDERKLLTQYISRRSDAASALEDLPLFEKAEASFASLSEDEIRTLSNHIQATAFKEIFDIPRYTPTTSTQTGIFTESELKLVLDLASCLALVKGSDQIAAADQLLKNDRLFGLSAYSLLTCPWYPEGVRAAALQRMAQEDPIVGREMAKIVLLRDKQPAVLEAARQILA